MRSVSTEVIIGIIAIVSLLLLVLGCLLYPDIFWDGLVWKYFWGPIVSDAGGTDELTSSYNWVDTLTYGSILAISVYYIHRLFQKLDLRVGLPFFVALSPVILLGPSLRVLEDMELFKEPLQYIFISPLIYIFLGISTLMTLLFSVWIERNWPGGGQYQRIALWLFLIIPGLVTSLLLEMDPGWWNGPPSFLIFISISVMVSSCAALSGRIQRYEWMLLIFWSEVVLFVSVFYGAWMTKSDFYQHYIRATDTVPDGNVMGAAMIIGLTLFVLSIITAVLWYLSGKYEKIGVIFNGVNIMILGGHMLDASATYVGIDHYGYVEKHRLPAILIDLTGTAAVMYPLKLLFIIPALYLMDVVMKGESRRDIHMMALVKLTILILGFAPGSRDLLR
ncbi:MAG: DUF63 family protein, partial [Thermoplasmata archaeon]|nr:DUF63 family protein [Thermoplasmata archaeon]